MARVPSWLRPLALITPFLGVGAGCSDDGSDTPAMMQPDIDSGLPGGPGMDGGLVLLPDGAIASDASLDVDAAPPGRTYYWTDWVDIRFDATDGGVDGVLKLPTSELSVAYRGDFYGAQVDGGSEVWRGSAYQSLAVGNKPPTTDVVMIEGGTTRPLTVRFARPVVDPALAITSLGSPTMQSINQYETPFEIASTGQGSFSGVPLSQLPENRLAGTESYGVILFKGTFSSLTWTAPVGERWHGFTVGIADVAPDGAAGLTK